MRRPTPYAVPFRGLQVFTGSSGPGKEDRPMSNNNKEQPKVTAGLDLGDKYSYLCLLDTESGGGLEEGRRGTPAETLQRRFAAWEPMRIAIEVGTHSPWICRLLERCG